MKNYPKSDSVDESLIHRFKLIMGDQSIRSFAKDIHVSDGTIHNILSGQIPSGKVCKGILNKGYSVDWLLNGDGYLKSEERPDPTPISNDIVFVDDILFGESGPYTAKSPFNKKDLEKHNINPYKSRLMTITDDSMSPTLSPDDIVLATSLRHFHLKEKFRNGIFVIAINNSYVVRRLQFDMDEGVTVICDNSVYENTHYPDKDKIEIISKVKMIQRFF